MDATVIDDRTRVCGAAAELLRAMLVDRRPAYAWASQQAVAGLRDGTLVGIQSSWSRFWITLHEHRARPARCAGGAHFQALERERGGRRELVGWIVLQDAFRGGPLVLVHEIGHWIHRFAVGIEAGRAATLVDGALAQGLDTGAVRRTRAQLLLEVAARHLAWLAESGADPGATRMPAPGALFACAVKIASYPEIYNDCGVMRRLVERADHDLLRDQVGAWIGGLATFPVFDSGSARAAAHRAWLRDELALAGAGRRAPRTPAEGTL